MGHRKAAELSRVQNTRARRVHTGPPSGPVIGRRVRWLVQSDAAGEQEGKVHQSVGCPVSCFRGFGLSFYPL